jgi:hypothetical protein
MWNLVSVRLRTVLVSVQDRCTVCAKRNIGMEIVLDTVTEPTNYTGLSLLNYLPITPWVLSMH